ncbi:hypothetical protein FS837_005939 [Tulasnella sp. UAMH 9824]|nr:hypothetical protein FS837_005939 [Tulasnella sp. UAMH 9824]
MSLSQATDITGGASLRSPSSYTTTTTAGFSAETLSTPKTTMDPVLPLTIVKRKKVGMQAPHHKVKAPASAQQAPLEVVQEESEPPSSASSTYSFDLSRSLSSPRSSYDSKRSVSTADTSPAPSLKRVSLDDSHNDTQEATATTTKEQKPTKMPCGTSFLHMGPPTPISTSPIPPASPPKPTRPPRNPLRQQRKPAPTAPLPPTPNDELPSRSNHPRLRPPKVVPQPVVIQTPPLQVLRPQYSLPQLPVARPATAPHASSSSSPSYYDTSRNTSTTSLSSTRSAQTTSNVALTQFEKRAARQALTSRGRSTLSSEASDAQPVFVYAFLSDSIILSLLFTRDLQKDVQRQPARIASGYEMSILEGGRSNYPLLVPTPASQQQSAVEGFLIYNLSESDRRKLQDFPFHPHWRRNSTPQKTTPLFEMIEVDVDDGTGKIVKATTIAWKKDVTKVTGLKLIPKAWDAEKGRKACVKAYLSVYCTPEKSAERLKMKKKGQKKQLRAKDDIAVVLRNVQSLA